MHPGTVNELLIAAVDVFDEKGYAATRLSDIADRAQMTTGAIYGHFKSKADVVERHRESWELVLENHTQLLERGWNLGTVRRDIVSFTTARVFYATLYGHMVVFREWFDHDPEGKTFRKLLRTQ